MKKPTPAATGVSTAIALALVVATAAVLIAHDGQTSQPVAASTTGMSTSAQIAAVPPSAPKVSHSATAHATANAASIPVVGHTVKRRVRLTPPDAVVVLSKAAAPRAVSNLEHAAGIKQVAVLDRGVVSVPTGHRIVKLSVGAASVGDVRSFTPQITAESRPLWTSVASGELTIGFSSSQPLRHKLGVTLPVAGRRGISSQLRVGAFATLGVPGVQAVVSKDAAKALQLRPNRELLIHAPKISLAALRADVDHYVGNVQHFTVTRVEPFDQSSISAYAAESIPTSYLDLYRRAAPTCPGLPWTVLAAIGTVETDNGRDVHQSVKGAEGPMQFLPSTWAEWGIDADGDGKANINDPVDAVFSAARYLCAAGASRGGQALNQAIFAYNHAWWYVREVVNLANEYA